MKKRIVSVWFPRLHSDRVLRQRPVSGPFAITAHAQNTDRVLCLNHDASRAGLERGMSLSDAHALCPRLRVEPYDPHTDQTFLNGLVQWARRYCPWVAPDTVDGLIMDITGSAHLLGGEEVMFDDMTRRLQHARLSVRIGIADTRGAAWALAHYNPSIAPIGETRAALRLRNSCDALLHDRRFALPPSRMQPPRDTPCDQTGHARCQKDARNRRGQ